MLWWLIFTCLVGAASGYLANRIMGKDTTNWVQNVIIGVVGSFVGGFISGLVGLGAKNLIGSLLISVLGSCASLWVYDKYIKK